MRLLIGIVVGAFAIQLVRQFRRPSGRLGRGIARAMNVGHSSLTDWGLQTLVIGKRATILDVGCGGGGTIHKLAAAATEGKVFGIDSSAAAVATARETNAEGIAGGCVDITQGSVSHLPFGDSVFDLVTAVETHYYWPDLTADLREILRVLKPGGLLVIVAEAYKGGRLGAVQWTVMKLLGGRVLSAAEHRERITEAGYADAQLREDVDKGWLGIVATRPAQAGDADPQVLVSRPPRV